MTVELQGSAMECADLARAIEAYLDGELDARERADADEHLAACPRCRHAVEHRARVRSALRRCLRDAMDAAPGCRAPPDLRLRIVDALEREEEPPRRRRRLPARLALVAAAALAAGAVATLALRRPDRLADEAVLRHSRDLPLEISAPAAEPVFAWLDGKLDFNPRPPRFAAPEVRVEGARLSHIGDRPAAYIRYQLPNGRVGLFIVDDPEGRLGESGRAVQVGPDVVRLAGARGYHLATWRRGAVVYSLVGDVGEEQLTALVRSAATR
jgi:anti-sigma factor RsiW